MLRQSRIRFAVGPGDCGAVAKRPYVRVARAAHRRLDRHSAASVLFDRQARYHRARDSPRGEDDRVGRNGFIRHVDLVRPDSLHSNVRPHFDSAPRSQDLGAILGKRRIDLRHDAISTLKQHESDLIAIHMFVQRNNAIHEGTQFAEQLHSDQSAADDDECEELRFTLWIGFHISAFESLNDVIAEK